MAIRTYLITIEVSAPHTTTEAEISNAINAALDEPPCDWQDWTVGAANVTGVRLDQSIEEA